MARSLVVPVVELMDVRPHPNADKLELCDVLGYQMCIPKDRHTSGDKVVYFPADTIIPQEWAEKFGVTNMLKGKEKNRVGKVRLRGEASFGLVAAIPEGESWEVGDNVADYFGCEQYEPPVKTTAGDAAKYDDRIDPYFERYTDIEDGRIFMDVFVPGEEVVITEKIHGGNCKLGFVKVDGTPIPIAGSMSYRRKRPGDERGDFNFSHPEMKRNTYWFPWTIEGVFDLLNALSEQHNSVLLYGEVYGGSVQKLNYGIPKGQGIGFRAFDLKVDGKYKDWGEFKWLCDKWGVPTVPVLSEGTFSFDLVTKLSEGKSTLADHIRKGVVVKPVKERVDPKIGRAVLKYIGTEYELSKHAGKDTKDV